MSTEASALIGRLVDAYGPYVRRVLSERGWGSVDGLDAAVGAGEVWLRESLDTLLSKPFPDQQRGPLELFQEAMQFPSVALAAAGLPTVLRDETATRALPGDTYDLAPRSSQLLGAEVWHTHLAWGAAKARAMTPRTVVAVTRNLIDASRIAGAASAAGMEAIPWTDESLLGASLVCVDLELSEAFEVSARVVTSGVSIVAYGPHRAAELLEAAHALGVDRVLPRSQFFRRLAVSLEEWADAK